MNKIYGYYFSKSFNCFVSSITEKHFEVKAEFLNII